MATLGLELKQLANFLESLRKPSDVGQTMVELNTNELLVISEFIESVCMTIVQSQNNPETRQTTQNVLYMLESLLQSKRTILKDNVITFQVSSQIVELLKTLGQVSISNEKDFLNILDESSKGRISKVVVSSKDRLCRFGFDLLEHLFKQNGTEIVVLDKTDKSPEEEFTEDILAVLQVFACRWNGKRSYSIKNKTNKVTIDVIPNENA